MMKAFGRNQRLFEPQNLIHKTHRPGNEKENEMMRFSKEKRFTEIHPAG
jgi:hypothetical protein